MKYRNYFKISFIALLLLFYSGLNAQKKSTTKSKHSTTKNKTAKKILKVDTIKVETGRKYAFLVDIDDSAGKVYDWEGEEKELKENYNEDSLNIIAITSPTYLKSNEGKYVDLSKKGTVYKSTIFWGGKTDGDFVVQQGRLKSTEFIGSQMGEKKQSSYSKNLENYQAEISELSANQKFTDLSKAVMHKYLEITAVPYCALVNDDYVLFNKDQKNVKSITTFFLTKKGAKKIFEKIELNEEGNPTSVERFDLGENKKLSLKLIYQNDMLTEIISEGRTTNLTYSEDKMIEKIKFPEGLQTTIYTLEKGNLLKKRFGIYNDETLADRNAFSEEKLKDLCIENFVSGKLYTRKCTSKTDTFPFTYLFTTFQDGEKLQVEKHLINKESDGTYKKYRTDNAETSAVTFLKLEYTITLNDKNLIETIDLDTVAEPKKAITEYTFYPFAPVISK